MTPKPWHLSLLQAVKDGYVVNGSVSLDEDMQGQAWLVDPEDPDPAKVTKSIAEVERDGLVHLPEPEIAWRLTPAGERVLTEHHGSIDE